MQLLWTRVYKYTVPMPKLFLASPCSLLYAWLRLDVKDTFFHKNSAVRLFEILALVLCKLKRLFQISHRKAYSKYAI